MKLLITMLLLITNAVAEEANLCQKDNATKSFISEWYDGEKLTFILTTIYGAEALQEQGRVAYKGDLNSDNNADYIFESFGSQGSARDRTFGIFIQCKGFLRFAGGDYFAGVKGVSKENDGYKSVTFTSYQRDELNEIIYRADHALVRSHVWVFNPKSEKYEESTK